MWHDVVSYLQEPPLWVSVLILGAFSLTVIWGNGLVEAWLR